MLPRQVSWKQLGAVCTVLGGAVTAAGGYARANFVTRGDMAAHERQAEKDRDAGIGKIADRMTDVEKRLAVLIEASNANVQSNRETREAVRELADAVVEVKVALARVSR